MNKFDHPTRFFLSRFTAAQEKIDKHNHSFFTKHGFIKTKPDTSRFEITEAVDEASPQPG